MCVLCVVKSRSKVKTLIIFFPKKHDIISPNISFFLGGGEFTSNNGTDSKFFFIVYTDKGAETMFADGEGPVFIESVKWLEDEDSRLQMAAVLAIGNFARNGQYLNHKAIKV